MRELLRCPVVVATLFAASLVSLTAAASATSAQAQTAAQAPPEHPAGARRPPSPGAAAVLPPAPSGLRGSSVSAAPGPDSEAPLWRFVINNLLVVRLDPAGLEYQMRLGFQRRLAELDGAEGRLFRDRFVFFGLAPKINPAFIKIGPSFEIQPLSIFNLRMAAEYIRRVYLAASVTLPQTKKGSILRRSDRRDTPRCDGITDPEIPDIFPQLPRSS